MTPTRFIAAALAFFTTFGFSSLLMQFALNKPEPQTFVLRSYSKPVNKQVLRFLEKDIRNGRGRMSRLSQPEWHYAPPFTPEMLTEYNEAVADYVRMSGAMDDSDLPADLQLAWRAHIKAWRDYSAFLNNLDNASAVETDYFTVRRMYREKDDRITATWFEVLEIAGENYGAYPAGAF